MLIPWPPLVNLNVINENLSKLNLSFPSLIRFFWFLFVCFFLPFYSLILNGFTDVRHLTVFQGVEFRYSQGKGEREKRVKKEERAWWKGIQCVIYLWLANNLCFQAKRLADLEMRWGGKMFANRKMESGKGEKWKVIFKEKGMENR